MIDAPGESQHPVFNWPVRVYWEDTDAGGIVFYANYLKFFERARTEWLRSLGVEQQRLKTEAGGMFVVAQAQLRYFRPARLDDRLRITARLVTLGRASVTIFQQALVMASPATGNVDSLQKSEQYRQSNKRLSADEAEFGTLLCDASIRIGYRRFHGYPAKLVS